MFMWDELFFDMDFFDVIILMDIVDDVNIFCYFFEISMVFVEVWCVVVVVVDEKLWFVCVFFCVGYGEYVMVVVLVVVV